jgi:hypothetical protein
MPPAPHPAIKAPLDPGFLPAVLFNRRYEETTRASGKGEPLVIGLEREGGLVSRFETSVMPDGGEETLRYVERIVKFLLWSRGGWKLQIGGPKAIGTFIRKTYSLRGGRKFDVEMMELAYGKKFEVEVVTADKVYAARDMELPVGGHMKGCRIGFDLGASDFKVSAVIEGEAVFTEETPWDPKTQADPGYHYHNISAALHRAAAHMPRVDAIGGSSAGRPVIGSLALGTTTRTRSVRSSRSFITMVVSARIASISARSATTSARLAPHATAPVMAATATGHSDMMSGVIGKGLARYAVRAGAGNALCAGRRGWLTWALSPRARCSARTATCTTPNGPRQPSVLRRTPPPVWGAGPAPSSGRWPAGCLDA